MISELKSIEVEAQAFWESKQIFEADASEDLSEPKYFTTFPYPYMNGLLHLGHTFTLSKCEFAVGYERLKGKKTLYPFSFHATGMPIAACADKLAFEMEARVPQLLQRLKEKQTVYTTRADNDIQAARSICAHDEQFKVLESMEALRKKIIDPNITGGVLRKYSKACADMRVAIENKTRFPCKGTAAQSGRGKEAAKATDAVYQWEILQMMGISDSEIPKFRNPTYWLEYFPPLAQRDLKGFGAKIDWRRSFTTTDMNPYYDSFVRWQFNVLHKQGDKLAYGKRYTIWSPSDNQPCMDHDRSSGEGVKPIEYTAIKFQAVAPFPEGSPLQKLVEQDRKTVYLVAVTACPETIFGQTNCWVHPETIFGAFEMPDNEVYIMSARSARNLSYQLNTAAGDLHKVADIYGCHLIGQCIRGNSMDIYVLPGSTMLSDSGTGITISVPSEVQADNDALMELKRGGQDLCIKEEWLIDPIIPSGLSVSDTRDRVCADLIEAGVAFLYAEPASPVVSRSGDDCVVCLTDQWYFRYGDPEWREAAKNALSRLNTFGSATKAEFVRALDWLQGWPMSRTYGLGTRVPWDERFLIESLSDSTLYPAYYTLAAQLQGKDNIFGSRPGPIGILPEQLTDDVWEYILRDGPYPVGRSDNIPPQEQLDILRKEFQYWYPCDMRVSGKDLIINHLTFYLYNHVAIFPPEKWPRGIRVNGYIMLDSRKMSKSTGNFMTLQEGLDRFGADTLRWSLAAAGDTIDDANFDTNSANCNITRLHGILQWFKIHGDPSVARRTGEYNFRDCVFDAQIDLFLSLTDQAYALTNYRAATVCLYDILTARDNYLSSTIVLGGMHSNLVTRFCECFPVAFSVMCPHICEKLWQIVHARGMAPLITLSSAQSVLNQRWPLNNPVNETLIAQESYVLEQRAECRRLYKVACKIATRKGTPNPASVVIFVARTYPMWQEKTLEYMTAILNETGECPECRLFSARYSNDPLMSDKGRRGSVMAFVRVTFDKYQQQGAGALALTPPFDELETLQVNRHYIQPGINLQVLLADDPSITDKAVIDKCTRARPGTPSYYFV